MLFPSIYSNSILSPMPMFSLSYLFFRHVHQNSVCSSSLPVCQICLIHLLILQWNIRILFVPEYKLHVRRYSLCSFVLSRINKYFDTKREENDILHRMLEGILHRMAQCILHRMVECIPQRMVECILHRMVQCIYWVRYGLNYFINTLFCVVSKYISEDLTPLCLKRLLLENESSVLT